MRADSGRTLDNEVGPQDTHGRDTNTGLCRAVCGAKAGEDDGAGAAHCTEEWLCLPSALSDVHLPDAKLFWAEVRLEHCRRIRRAEFESLTA